MAGKANGRKARNGGGEITMSDIARHAGVSPMTVSRALSDPASVSDKMRRKVDATVRQSMNSAIDALVVRAARNWKYQPAMKDGAPVRYSKTLLLVP